MACPFTHETPWIFPYEKKYGGCRSWIDLPKPPEGWDPENGRVMGDDVFATLDAKLLELMG